MEEMSAVDDPDLHHIFLDRHKIITEFKREAIIMARLGPHPRLVRFLGVVCEESTLDQEWRQTRTRCASQRQDQHDTALDPNRAANDNNSAAAAATAGDDKDGDGSQERCPAEFFKERYYSIPGLDLVGNNVDQRLARLAQRQTLSVMDLRAFEKTLRKIAVEAAAGERGRKRCSSPPLSPALSPIAEAAAEFDEIMSQEGRNEEKEGEGEKQAEEAHTLRQLAGDAACRRHTRPCQPSPTYCLLLEFMPGGNLKQSLEKLKQEQAHFDWQTAMRIMLDVSEAMHFLHSHSIIHRDLKSSNVLLTGDFRAKLADFGFCREILPRAQGHYTFCGSAHWIAPELWRNEPHCDKVDTYSFSMVVWSILSRSTPFSTFSFPELCQKVGFEKLRPPLPRSGSGATAEVPERLKRLIEGCWHDEQRRRPDFGEIRLELYKVKDDIPDTAARMPLWENVQAQDIMAPQALRERVRSVRVVPVQTATE